jgi:GH24 family phage-related lysozyme (muramidase)
MKLYNRSGGKVSNGLVQRRAEEGQIWMGQGPYAE